MLNLVIEKCMMMMMMILDWNKLWNKQKNQNNNANYNPKAYFHNFISYLVGTMNLKK
jgi:hypothetical protein